MQKMSHAATPRGMCTLKNLNPWEKSHNRETQNDKSCAVIRGLIDSELLGKLKQILDIEIEFKIIVV